MQWLGANLLGPWALFWSLIGAHRAKFFVLRNVKAANLVRTRDTSSHGTFHGFSCGIQSIYVSHGKT
jgi:hypothetical protein